ncbi:MAG: GNVR domain-containing protein [Ferruginibacter sp.]
MSAKVKVKAREASTAAGEENIVEVFLARFIPYWPLFALVFVAGLAAAFVYFKITPPVYEAKASIMINDEKKGTEESKLTESLVTVQSKQLVENEIEVLKSHKLMDSVVNRLNLYATVFNKKDKDRIPAFNSSPVWIVAKDPADITPVKRAAFTYNKATSSVTIDGMGKPVPLNTFIATNWGEIKFIKNTHFDAGDKDYDGTNQYYFSLNTTKQTTAAILQSLAISAASKLSTVIELRLRDHNPQRAELILDNLLSAYETEGLRAKNDVAKNTLAFVEERLADVTHQMDSMQKKVQGYKTSAGAVDIGTQGQLFLQNVSENDQKLSTVNTQLSVLDQVENFVSSRASEGAIVPSTLGVEDPMLSQMLDKLYSTELEYKRMGKTVGEGNPKMLALKDQIDKMRPDILSNLRSQKQSLLASRQNISATNGQYNSMLRTMPQKEKALLQLTRDEATLNGVYEFLLQKKEESVLSFSSNLSNHKVMDNAQAGIKPVSPKKPLVLALAVLLPLLLLMGILALRDFFFNKILYRKQIESYTSIPVIAEISAYKSTGPIVVEKGKRTLAAEEFRKLNLSLMYAGISDTAKKILITSSISGEGKSFIAANLAAGIAASGKKTVIVDMDFHNSSLAEMYKDKCKPNQKGVIDFLLKEAKVEELLVQVADNLYYIPVGKTVASPSEILANSNVAGLISNLEAQFERVLIDSSPVGLVVDGYFLSGLCNATLFVVRHKYTPKMLIKQLDENNNVNPINNPCIVFNGIQKRGFVKTGYGYGYGFQYLYDTYGNKKN